MTLLSELRTVEELELENRRVFFRLDLDVTVDADSISPTDLGKLQAALPSLRYAAEAGARLIIGSHRGQPKGRHQPELTLEPVGLKLAELAGWDILLPDECVGDAARKAIADMRQGQAVLLENLRFHAGEESDDDAFARELAAMTDVYVNDALAASNREHASLHALPRLLRERGIGMSMQAELKALSRVLEPELPLVAVLGGTRLNERFELILSLLRPERTLCFGGALACIFLSAKGYNVGGMKIDPHDQARARTLLEQAMNRDTRIVLPEDFVVTTRGESSTARVTPSDSISPEEDVVDIGPATFKQISSALSPASTVLWVGAMGMAGHPIYSAGTINVARAIADCPAYTTVIGAAPLAALRQAGEDIARKIDCICAGGGAALELLEGRRLPGLDVLRHS
jgi:phosphoglycerate kinase